MHDGWTILPSPHNTNKKNRSRAQGFLIRGLMLQSRSAFDLIGDDMAPIRTKIFSKRRFL